jgi:hypothetical protein
MLAIHQSYFNSLQQESERALRIGRNAQEKECSHQWLYSAFQLSQAKSGGRCMDFMDGYYLRNLYVGNSVIRISAVNLTTKLLIRWCNCSNIWLCIANSIQKGQETSNFPV